jgi:murein DD-endopeptidase MepM/ murein hydrolase activator NlpD
MLGGDPHLEESALRYKFRNLAVVGLSVALLAACGKPATESTGTPDFVEPSATPALVTGTTAAPSASSSAPAAAASTSKSASPKPSPSKATKITYTFPVIGNNGYAHTHHDYPASDIINNCGNKVVAVTSGVIVNVVRKDTWTAKVNAGATRGGLSVALLGDDGVRYYGSHMSVILSSIKIGARVKTGQQLGKTGRTGDAGACHVHFGISPPCAKGSDWWNQRGVIWPWPYLDSWKKGGNKSPVAEIKAWKAKHGCPTKPSVDP